MKVSQPRAAPLFQVLGESGVGGFGCALARAGSVSVALSSQRCETKIQTVAYVKKKKNFFLDIRMPAHNLAVAHLKNREVFEENTCGENKKMKKWNPLNCASRASGFRATGISVRCSKGLVASPGATARTRRADAAVAL